VIEKMELAVPTIALGLLYIVSNQKKGKENFSGQSKLPNTNIADTNYPENQYYDPATPNLDQTAELTVNNKYDNAGGAYTDKYFNANMNQGTLGNASLGPVGTGTQYYSLTGEKVGSDYFVHNNMQPFFGSNARNAIANSNVMESIMDSYSGSGSQIITKKEVSPLFAPNENMQWAHGAPNRSDFFQSRVNPSLRMANVNPFEQPQSVAPGLGLGYGTEGAGGYNSGMMAREQWLDKTADQLRVDSKPKATGFSLLGHEGPADSYIKRIATQEQMGVMEKNRPETSFAWDTRTSGGDHGDIGRLTPGSTADKGYTLRAIPVERNVSRPDTAVSYGGIAGGAVEATYLPGEYMPTHMQELGAVPIGVANANGRNYATDADFEIKAKAAYPNNRTANKQDNYFGIVGGGMGAVIAPLLDVLRPNRKNNVIGTLRPYQNPSTTVKQSYVFNPADRPATTIRETTEQGKGHLNINSQTMGAYQVTDHQVPFTNRNEVGVYSYTGGSSAGPRGRQMTSYEANYNQRNNVIKSSTIQGHMVPGNMSLMNGDINMRQVSRDSVLQNQRAVIGTMPAQIPDATILGKESGNTNQLYSTIQADRNASLDITQMLKSNPYVVNYRNSL
jgi:hypothetical protein